ncbi:hypothetical protein [Mechercharimyces sp. CAU 1602]|uniref:hypothetical protein n=1 Tax=Mechercharimyces sp. CAU 1602 TaxID=2973933 RepID=UPI00216180BC|nr:hypothetical protein [Mechercharimyces sp. CAU 1602]MCS1350912.1 hypothetical protein [Mechercharimyces sp. CAU 1602]
MKYFEEAKVIWKKYVPKSGQAESVEGELLRAIEKLRYEAQNNGNGNWDNGFERFCTYLWEVLDDRDVFSYEVLQQIKKDFHTLRNYKKPYVKDDLYDRMTDRMIEWSFANKGPVLRENDPNQYR